MATWLRRAQENGPEGAGGGQGGSSSARCGSARAPGPSAGPGSGHPLHGQSSQAPLGTAGRGCGLQHQALATVSCSWALPGPAWEHFTLRPVRPPAQACCFALSSGARSSASPPAPACSLGSAPLRHQTRCLPAGLGRGFPSTRAPSSRVLCQRPGCSALSAALGAGGLAAARRSRPSNRVSPAGVVVLGKHLL